MGPIPPDLETLANLLRDTARLELLPRYQRVGHTTKADGSLVTEADIAIQQRLSAELTRHWPHIALLGEEMDSSTQQRLMADPEQPLWLLDPLDGTSNFAAGLPYFALSLALREGDSIRFGLVYDPIRDQCFCAERGAGAWLNGEPLRPAATARLDECLAIVDLKRLDLPLLQRLVATPPYRSQRSFGAAALEWCWLAAGHCAIYLHGRQMPWDHAAGALILHEAGGALCDLHGAPLDYTAQAPTGVIAAGNPALFQTWCDWLEVKVKPC